MLTLAESAESRAATTTSKKRLKEIAETSSTEFEVDAAAPVATTPLVIAARLRTAAPIWWRLKSARLIPIRAKLVVFLPFLRVAQDFVSLVDLLKFLFRRLFILGHIRVIFARELPESAANLFVTRRFRDAQCLVIITKLHRHLVRMSAHLRRSQPALTNLCAPADFSDGIRRPPARAGAK